MTPLGAILRGLAAGAVGTAAMDLVWFIRYKRGGGETGLIDWEFSVGLQDWSKASSPARVGKRLFEAFFERELSVRWAMLTNIVMHWGYGMTWGAMYGILAGSASRPPRAFAGFPFASFVWAFSYVMLPLAHAYKPIWEYDLPTLGRDWSAHLAFGFGTAATFKLLARRKPLE